MKGVHICCFTDFSDIRLVTWDGQVFRFEFSKMFGPMMLGKRGQPVEARPPKRSPFWPALHHWCVQGHRVDEHGCCVYNMPPVTVWVRLVGRHWAMVPDGQSPAAVRAEWFEKAKLPPPNDRVETMERTQ